MTSDEKQQPLLNETKETCTGIKELKVSVAELKQDVRSLKESRAKRSAAIKALADEVKALNNKMDRIIL